MVGGQYCFQQVAVSTGTIQRPRTLTDSPLRGFFQLYHKIDPQTFPWLSNILRVFWGAGSHIEEDPRLKVFEVTLPLLHKSGS
jgi:hypothetical protein